MLEVDEEVVETLMRPLLAFMTQMVVVLPDAQLESIT